jgi:acyl carrier protein
VRTALLAPISFDASLRDIFLPLVCGGAVAIPERDVKENPALLLRWIRDKQISVLHAVPSFVRLLLDEAEGDHGLRDTLRRLKAVGLAGEPLYGRDVQRLRALAGPHTRICNFYGATETTLIKLVHDATAVEPALAPKEMIPLGIPIDGASAYVVANSKRAAIDEVGEIYIETPFASMGYLDDAESTAQRFEFVADGAGRTVARYRTGDLGRRRADGTLVFAGRLDDQIKIRGNRVNLVEVEKIAQTLPGVIEAAAVVDRNGGSPSICCFFKAARGISEDEMSTHFRSLAPSYYRPSRAIRVETFPLTLNNKIDKKRLLQSLRGADGHCAGQRSATETAVARIVADLSGAGEVDRDTSLLALGYSSLDAMRLIARLYREYGCRLTVAQVFEGRTIAGVAARIEETGSRTKSDVIEPAEPASSYPLSPYQLGMWSATEHKPAALAYNQIVCYELTGNISVAACRTILAILVQSFELLRTRYELVDGVPRQLVQPYSEDLIKLHYVDLRSRADPTAAMMASVEQEAATEWSFEVAAPFHCCLYRTDDRRYVLSCTFYHLIGDVWSIALIRRHAASLYREIAAGNRATLAAPRLQFKDMCVWLQGRMPALRNASRSYWRTALCELSPPLDLGTERRPPARTFRGRTARRQLTDEQIGNVLRLAPAMGCSAFSIGLLALSLLVRDSTGRSDMVIGAPISLRDVMDAEDQFGMFLNMVPIRIRLGAERSVRRMLAIVTDAVAGAFEHKMCPFDEIVRATEAPTRLNRSPLFDVIFTYVVAAESHLVVYADEDLSVRTVPYWPATSKYDLNVMLVDNGDILFEYNTDLIDEARAAELIDGYGSRLSGLSGALHEKR